MIPYLKYILCIITLISSVSKAYGILKSNKKSNRKSGELVFEMVKNSPTIHTKSSLVSRHVTYYWGYRNLVSAQWVMGLGFNHKSFTDLKEDQELSFFTLQHESFRIIRVHHPLYLLIGPRIIYLMPTKKSQFIPLSRNSEIRTEIGFGMTIMLETRIDNNYKIVARIDRWRGTKTDKFHGYEVGLGISRSL